MLIPIPKQKTTDGMVIRIANFDYAVPAWWNSVEVSAPECLTTQDEVRAFIEKHYGANIGSENTWREELKIWADWYRRQGDLPVQLANCHKAGGEFARAAQIYGSLYRLADSLPTETAFIRCYLAYGAGECYSQLKEFDRAKRWYSRAAEYAKHEDSAVRYYGETASRKLASLEDR